jgi:UDP-N-acetylmuramoyl-tripeptide--D-alanyl-D-alanine ligase
MEVASMRPRRLSEVAEAVGGGVVGPDVEVDVVTTDSRAAGPRALFVARAGEDTDGHRFVPDAFANGASAAMVNQVDESAGERSYVVVGDPGRGLLDLASSDRARLRATVVGVTGSTGKTCTKDLTAAVLRTRFEVVASPGSFNNQVGMPLTIVSAGPATDVLVLEMGSRGIGHIRDLCAVARPDAGIVTNVGLAHLGFFGSRENIVTAKAELVEALPPGGVALLNADDPVVARFRARTPARVLAFGVNAGADVRAEGVELDRDARASFTLVAAGLRERVELLVPGEHMVSNALAAAACGIALGVSPGECAAALKDAHVSGWRMETLETPDGVRVVNDAYNANPTSMAAALKAARWMSRGGRCIAVLGGMAELGDASAEEHDHVGELVARLGIEDLVVVGDDAAPIARAALREGMEPEHVARAPDRDAALAAVQTTAREGDLVLVKASRVNGLEWLAEALRNGGAA